MLSNAALAEFPGLAVIKSISKACGISGLRLGMLATGDAARLAAIRNSLPLWNINSVAEFFLQIFGKYDKAYAAACKALVGESARVLAALAQIPHLSPIGCGGGYILCKVASPCSAAELAASFLNRHGILLRDCSAKRGLEDSGSYLRLAVGMPADNDRLLALLRSSLSTPA